MPHHVRKVNSKKWAIVNSVTGQVKGYSKTKTKALASARIRDQASGHGKARG